MKTLIILLPFIALLLAFIGYGMVEVAVEENKKHELLKKLNYDYYKDLQNQEQID